MLRDKKRKDEPHMLLGPGSSVPCTMRLAYSVVSRLYLTGSYKRGYERWEAGSHECSKSKGAGGSRS